MRFNYGKTIFKFVKKFIFNYVYHLHIRNIIEINKFKHLNDDQAYK